MNSIGWKLFATAVFVLLNGFFVAAEFALVKVRVSRVQSMADSGSKRAQLVAYLLDNMNLYLSACQLGITLASLILGWLAEPAIAAGLKMLLSAMGVELHATVLHIISLAFALTMVTLLHMVIGEQVPKIWAIQRAEQASYAIAYPLRFFAIAFKPLIWLINSMSNGLLRLLGVNPEADHEGVHDASELRTILASSASAGKITIRQREFAQNILEITDLEVRHMLVPRSDIVWLSNSASAKENLRKIHESGHSRFPLCESDLDSILGIVHAKSLLEPLCRDDAPDFKSLAREPTYVPDTLPLSRLIVELQGSRAGCAVVVDERDTMLGLVFLDDAIEEIVGPIHDEFDDSESDGEPRLTKLSDNAVEISGDMSFPEAKQLLGLQHDSDSDTIGGFVTTRLKSLPSAGDQLLVGPYRVKVIGISGRRIRRLRFDPTAGRTDESATDETRAAGDNAPDGGSDDRQI